MSNHQTVSLISSFKSMTAAKKVPIKLLSRVVSANQKSFKVSSNKIYSVSKTRDNSLISALETQINGNFQISKILTKHRTSWTETFSDRKIEVLQLEKQFESLTAIESPQKRFSSVMALWEQTLNLNSPLSNIFSSIKTEVEKFVNYLQEKIFNSSKDVDKLEEFEQTLKILKKRFKKLALENLEVNNLIKEKENSLFRVKEKFRGFRERKGKELVEKNEEIKELRVEVLDVLNEINEFRRKNKMLYQKVKYLKKIVTAVRNSEEIDSDVKERVLGVLSLKDRSISISHDKSLILASTTSVCNSFLSGCEFDI